MARFLLNLQETKRRLECGSQSLGEMSSLAFVPPVGERTDGFMGDLGGHLSFDDEGFPGIYDELS